MRANIDVSGRVPDQRVQQGRFSGFVPPDHRDLLSAARRLAVNGWNNGELAVTLRESFYFERMATTWLIYLEPDERPLDVRFREFRSLKPLHFLLAGHNITCEDRVPAALVFLPCPNGLCFPWEARARLASAVIDHW